MCVRQKLERFQVTVIGIVAFWYVALFPGRIGYDYVLLARMIREGKSTGWWGATYFWFYKFLTFDARALYVISLIGLLALFHAIRFFVYSLPISVKLQKRALVFFISTPLFGVFGVTVSHDVFQCAGIILLVSLAIRESKNTNSEASFSFTLVLAGFYLTTTHIGLIIFGIFLIPKILKRNFWILLLFVSMCFISFFAHLIIKQTDEVDGFAPTTLRNLVLVDLKCIVQHPDVRLEENEWIILQKYAPKTSWLEQTSCSNPDILAAPLNLDKVRVPADASLYELFVKLVTQEPSIPIMSHIQRSRVALPPPFFQPPSNQVPFDIEIPLGQGTNTALQTGPGILHPSIDDEIYDIRMVSLRVLEAIALLPAFLLNQASWFWSWGGLWLWPILMFFIKWMRLRGWHSLMPVMSPILALHLLVFIVGPSSLGRYVMSTIFMGVILSYIQISSYLNRGTL